MERVPVSSASTVVCGVHQPDSFKKNKTKNSEVLRQLPFCLRAADVQEAYGRRIPSFQKTKGTHIRKGENMNLEDSGYEGKVGRQETLHKEDFMVLEST